MAFFRIILHLLSYFTYLVHSPEFCLNCYNYKVYWAHSFQSKAVRWKKSASQLWLCSLFSSALRATFLHFSANVLFTIQIELPYKMLRFMIKSANRILLPTQSAFRSTQRFYGRITSFWVQFPNNECVNSNFCFSAAPKRFYKNAGILNCNGKYEITLDSKKLKTPSGAVFQVSNEPLAIASM